MRRATLLLVLGVALADPQPSTDGPVVGIDLGGTYARVGYYNEKLGQVEIIPDEQGRRTTPSYVAFTGDGGHLVGDAAMSQAAVNPSQTLFRVTRLLGRPFQDAAVQEAVKVLPYSIVDHGGKPMISVRVDGEEDKSVSPEEVSAMILARLKATAEKYLGQEVKRAVIAVPTHYNDQQRMAIKEAGSLAGLEVLRVTNEAFAVAFAYGLDRTSGKNILVYDLGGSSLDVSLLTVEDGVLEVLADRSDAHLAGDAFDRRLMQHFTTLFQQRHGKDISEDKHAVQRLRLEVERVKCALSSSHEARLHVEALHGGHDLSEVLTRAQFEQINDDLFRRSLDLVSQLLQITCCLTWDAETPREQVHELVLVGGSSRIPKVRELVTEFFGGKEPHGGIDPAEAVAHGAALVADIVGRPQPATIGSACQAMWSFQVNRLSLGVETSGGIMANLIDRNTVIPVTKSRVFSTSKDNQTSVTIRVFEGERPWTKDNFLLGTLELGGIAPAPRGSPQIEVTLGVHLGAVGPNNLTVSAVDKGRNHSQELTIVAYDTLFTEDQAYEHFMEAGRNEDADRQVREARLAADGSLEAYLEPARAATPVAGNGKVGAADGEVHAEL